VFLPWHRLFLIRLEEQLQRVANDAETALPYWNWAADGELPADEQPQAPLWDLLGETSGDVVSGTLGSMQVRLVGFGMQLWSVPPRPLTRNAAADDFAPTLPTTAEVAWALDNSNYDVALWDAGVDSFATGSRAGSTRRPAPGSHRSHATTTGSTSGSVGTWARAPHPTILCSTSTTATRTGSGNPGWPEWGQPTDRSMGTQCPQGHRLEDQMLALLGDSLTPAEVLDPTAWYVYDQLVDTT
jgi:tyrosinase